jgi:Acetyltransferase (GNAT) domain
MRSRASASAPTPNRMVPTAPRSSSAMMDLLDDVWEMSWTVAPEHRGKGVGAAIVQLAVSRMTGERVFAEIKAANFASRRIAEKSGFRLREDRDGMLVYWRGCTPSLPSEWAAKANFGERSYGAMPLLKSDHPAELISIQGRLGTSLKFAGPDPQYDDGAARRRFGTASTGITDFPIAASI